MPDPVKTGGTPITSSLAKAVNRLRNFSDWDRKIILVTDGQETEKTDYRESVDAAMELHGIPCSVFVIGLTQNPEAEAMSRALAQDTNGGYINLKTTKIDSDSISSKLAPLKIKVLQQQSKNVIMRSESQQISPIKSTALSSTSKVTEDKYAKINTESAVQLEQKLDESPILSAKVELQNELEREEPSDNTIDPLIEVLNKVNVNTQVLGSLGKQIEIIQSEISKISSANEIAVGEVIPLVENKTEQDRVGKKAEKLIFEVLKEKYGKRLLWVNEGGESGKPFDYQVIDGEEVELFIDCKATKHAELNFYMTDNEWNFFLRHAKNYQIYFVSNLDSEDRIVYKIDNLMDWLINGKVVPFSSENRAIKANRVFLDIKK